MTEEVEALAKKLGLTPDVIRYYLSRISWRRQTMVEQRGNFDEKYPEDALTAFLTAGNQYFDKQIVIARKKELLNFKPLKSFRDGQAVFFHKRIPGRKYIMGVDTARGVGIDPEHLDYATAVVLDLDTGEEMAALRARLTPEALAYDIADMGRFYNDALIAVERTGDGMTCILTLTGECAYSAIYKHKDWLKRSQTVVELEGFPTTAKTRPIALNFLNRFVLEHPELIWDETFLDEALVFVRNEKGIPAASNGSHDDTVACRWVAHAARMATLGYWLPHVPRKEGVEKEGYIPADRIVATV